MIPSMTAPGGKLLGITVFDTAGSHSFTPLAGAKSFKVTCIGGGGGSGQAGAGGGNAFSAGGGQGGTSIKFYERGDLSFPVAVTVGAGGTAGTSGAGGNGGETNFAGTCIANGGGGSNSTTPGAGGGGTGDIVINGVVGESVDTGANPIRSGVGGGNSAAPRITTQGTGIAGQSPGAGANGALRTTSNQNGAAGFRGICIIEQYG